MNLFEYIENINILDISTGKIHISIPDLIDDDYRNKIIQKCKTDKDLELLADLCKVAYARTITKEPEPEPEPVGKLLSGKLADIIQGSKQRPKPIDIPIVDDTESDRSVSASLQDLERCGLVENYIFTRKGLRSIFGKGYVASYDNIRSIVTSLGFLHIVLDDGIIKYVCCDFEIEQISKYELSEIGLGELEYLKTSETDYIEISESEKFVDDFESLAKDDQGWEIYVERIKSKAFSMLWNNGFSLPGNGPYRDSCQQWKLSGCLGSGVSIDDQDMRVPRSVRQDDLHKENGDRIKKQRMSCDKLNCEKCFPDAITKISKKASDRMWAFLLMLNTAVMLDFQRTRIFNHMIVSIPRSLYQDMQDEESRKGIESKITKIMKSRLNVEGGMFVYHPFRFTRGLKSAYFSPHYHFIITGYYQTSEIKKIYEETGLIFKSKTFTGKQDCYNLVRYLMTHAGVSGNTHRVRYFGMAHNSKFKTHSINSESMNSFSDVGDLIEYIRNGLNRTESKTVQYRLRSIVMQRYDYIEKIDVRTWQSKEVMALVADDEKLLHKLQDVICSERIKSYDKDNPAYPKSDFMPGAGFELESHIAIRLDYDVKPLNHIEKWRSKSKNLVLEMSRNHAELCNLCRFKMKPVLLVGNNPQLITDLEYNITFPIDNDVIRYYEDYDYRGDLVYYDTDGNKQKDEGILRKHDAHNDTHFVQRMNNQKLIDESILKTQIRKTKSRLWKDLGRKPELSEINKEMGIVAVTPRKTKSQKLFDSV